MLRFSRLALSTALWLTTMAVVHPANAADPTPWLDSSWAHRVKLSARVQFLPPSGTLENFSLLVSPDTGSLAPLFASSKADGSDLLFTEDDGVTPIEHEIVDYDSAGNTAEIWFKAPQLSMAHHSFYLYYGNPDTTITPLMGAAFSPEYLAVYHFAEDPELGFLEDSGSGDNYAITGESSGWTASQQVPGQIGKAWSFDGQQNWVNSDQVASTDSTYTISAWASRPSGESSGRVAFQSLDGFWNTSFQRSGGDLHPDLETANGFMTWAVTIPDTLMHHFVWTLDAVSDTAMFYLDGVAQPVAVHYAPATGHVYTGEPIGTRIGIAGPALFNSLDLMEGMVDEYRIAEGVRTPDWITAEFQNQSQGAAFFVYEVQDVPTVVGVDPILPRNLGRISVWPNPFSFAAQIDVESSAEDLAVEIYDLAGRRVRTLRPRSANPGTLQLSWDGRDQSGIDVSSGVYYVRAVGRDVNLKAKVLLVR